MKLKKNDVVVLTCLCHEGEIGVSTGRSEDIYGHRNEVLDTEEGELDVHEEQFKKMGRL